MKSMKMEKNISYSPIWKNGKPIEVWYSAGKDKRIRTGRDIDVEMSNHPAIAPKWLGSYV